MFGGTGATLRPNSPRKANSIQSPRLDDLESAGDTREIPRRTVSTDAAAVKFKRRAKVGLLALLLLAALGAIVFVALWATRLTRAAPDASFLQTSPSTPAATDSDAAVVQRSTDDTADQQPITDGTSGTDSSASSTSGTDSGASSILDPDATAQAPNPSPPPIGQTPPPPPPPADTDFVSNPDFNLDAFLAGTEAADWALQQRASGFEIEPTTNAPLRRLPDAVAAERSNYKYDYELTLFRAFLFFEVQRGGVQAADSRTWRQYDASALDEARLGSLRKNLTGGWWEAGNHLKVTIPTAFTVSRLAWTCHYHRATLSALTFSRGGSSDFGDFFGVKSNADLFSDKSAYEWCKREVQWGARWLAAANIEDDGATVGLVVQCGISSNDFGFFGNAEKMPGGPSERPCAVATPDNGAADHAGEAAAGLATAAALFQDGSAAERAEAAEWLTAARNVQAFGMAHRGTAADWFSDAKILYRSSMAEDHLMLGAAALFWSLLESAPTEAQTYGRQAMTLWQDDRDLRDRCNVNLANWDTPCAHAMLLMVQGSGHYDSWFAVKLRDFAEAHVGDVNVAGTRATGRDGLKITPQGARMFEAAANSENSIVWGTLRNQALAGSIASAVADFPGAPSFLRARYGCLAASQLNYILGDTGRSFVVGQGVNPPENAHSRDAFCTLEDSDDHCDAGLFSSNSYPNPNVLVGALISGPDLFDQFTDRRSVFQATEVAVDYQAGLVGLLATVLDLPASFWQGGDLAALAQHCDDNFMRLYPWDA